MVHNTISIVAVLQASLLTLIWLTCTTAGERVHNPTNEKSSPNIDSGDHTALNKFIEDVLKARDELADIRTMDVGGLHKSQKDGYPSGVSTADHGQQKSSGSANIHTDLNIVSAHGKETSSSNQMKTHDKLQHPQNTDIHVKNEKNEKNEKLFQSKNNAPHIKTTGGGGGKMSRNIGRNYRKQSYQQNLGSNEDDAEMLKYLTSNFPKGNRLFQQGQMQEKQTLDADRLSQIFSAMKKNYFPTTAAVKTENTRENSDESTFDQSSEEGNDKMLYEDLLNLSNKQIDAGNEPMQTSPLEYKQLDDKDANAIQNEGRHESHLEDKTLDDQDEVGKELRFLNHLEDDPVDWKDTSRSNEPSYTSRLERKPLDENYGVRNGRMYSHDSQDKARDEKYGVENERYTRYLKNKRLDKKFNLGDEPSYGSNSEDKHANDKEALENELGYSRHLEEHLDNDKHFHSRPRVRSDNAEDQQADSYSSAYKTSDQEGEDPAVVKYFQTHGRRHNRNAHSNAFESGSDNDCAKYANSEENAEPPDENAKLRQAHERLQLEDADGLLVGMRARIGTTDNQMELENVNQDKVVPKPEQEEDIQQQLEEEKLIFYPYVPGQTPALSNRADESNPFTNERDQKNSISPDAANTMPQANSEALTDFQQINGKELQAFHLDKPNSKMLSDENEQIAQENEQNAQENEQNVKENEQNAQENDVRELGDSNGQNKEDDNLSEDYNVEPILSQSSDESNNRGYYEEKHLSPIQRHVYNANKRSIGGNPQSVQNLIMDGSQELYPSYNLRHLLDFEGDDNQQTNLEQQVHKKQQSVRNKRARSNIKEQKRNTVDDSNDKTYMETPSFSGTSQRHRRAVVKRPGAIWLDDESDIDYEEGQEEAHQEDTGLASNALEVNVAKHVHKEEANQQDTKLGSNALEVNKAKHVPLQLPAKYQTPILDTSLAFRSTADTYVPAKRNVRYAHKMKNVNLNEESKRKRRSKNNPTNDATMLNESDLGNDVDSDSEVQMSEDFKNKGTHTNQVKQQEEWHKKLKGLENKYKNFKDKSMHARISEKVHHNRIGKNKVVEAKDKVSLTQEKESSQVDQLSDPSLRSDAQSIKPGSDDDELEEYKDTEQDSYKDSDAKLKGTNVRSLLEKTSKDYEDVTKELKQVMKSLVTQGKTRKGFDSESKDDSLYNEFEAQNTGPLEVVKLGRPRLKEEYQNQPLAENNDENDHISVGYPSQSSKYANLADGVETEEKENNLKMEYESSPRKKKEMLDSYVNRDGEKQSTEEGLNNKLDYYDQVDSRFGPNSKRGVSEQLREVEQPVSKIQNYDFSKGSHQIKFHNMHPVKLNEYSYKSNPTQVSESLETHPEWVKIKLQSAMDKEIGNEDNLSDGISKSDTNEDSNYIAQHEAQSFNDGYDAFNESPFNDRDDLASLESRKHYFNSNVKKRSNNVQHSRNIPQELFDVGVSTRELDRLISEGNLPVLKRVKRSHNDSVSVDSVVSENVIKRNVEIFSHERKMGNAQNVGLNEQEESTFDIPGDREFWEEKSVLFKKNLEGNKDTEMNQNEEETGNSHIDDNDEKAKREIKEKYNILLIRDILSKGKNKAKGVNSANDHGQESPQLAEDHEVIQQISQREHDDTKSVNGIENHFLNKRETIHNRNPNVHTANTIKFSNKRHIVNTLGNGNMRNVNQMYHNNAGKKTMTYGEKRRNTFSDIADHSPLQHGKYRVNTQRQDRSGSQGRNNDNFKEELDPHSTSKLSHQIRRNKMDVDYKMKHLKGKAVRGMKRGSAAADSDVLQLLSDQQPDNRMIYDNTRSQISNQGYSKLKSIKAANLFQDNSLIDNESFGNDLLDYATDDKSSASHGAPVSKNVRFVNTHAHRSPDESQKLRSSTSNDYGWNAQLDEREMHDTIYENPRNALSNGNLRKFRNHAEDASSKHSLTDDLYHVDGEKERPQIQYNSKFSSGTKSNHHFMNLDNSLPSDHYSDLPDLTGDKEEDTSYSFKNYNLGNSAGNTESSVPFLENNQHADSNSKLLMPLDIPKIPNFGNIETDDLHYQNMPSSQTSYLRPVDIPNFGHSETNNLNYQYLPSSQTSYLQPGEYNIFPALSLRAKQPTRCATKPSTWSQSDDSIPLFPVVDQKNSKPYNGELDDGLLGMNIVDTILNQVFGSKNLQTHIGPGLHRNYTPTKIEQMNTQSRARQKIISQISTIIDKGLEEERKQKACMQLPSCLHKFLDWLVRDDKCPPSNHRGHSQSSVHPFYTYDQQHNTSPTKECSDLQKKSELLKKLGEEYDKLSECEKSQVQNVHDVLSTETKIVNKLLDDEKHSKQTCSDHESTYTEVTGNSNCSSETEYNLPVLNYEDPMSSPGGNDSQDDLPSTFLLPPVPDALGNDSTLDQTLDEEDDQALITQDLEGLGLHQNVDQSDAGCNECEQHFGKSNRDSHTDKNNLPSPDTYNSHDGLTKDQWMNDFERTRVDDDAKLSRRSYMDASKRSQGGQTSNEHWPRPEVRYNNDYLDARDAKGARHQREFGKDVEGEYGSQAEYGRNSAARGNGKRSHYLGNDQGKYYGGMYRQAAHEHPERSRAVPVPAHVSNEYRRLLARAEQIRRKRSRGERRQETSWRQ